MYIVRLKSIKYKVHRNVYKLNVSTMQYDVDG